MKSQFLISVLLLSTFLSLNAQIYTPGGIIQGSSGSNNVGIGIANTGSATLKVYKDTYPEIMLTDNKGSVGIQLAQNNGDNAPWAKPGDAIIRKWGMSHSINFVLNDDNNDGNSYFKFGDNYNGAVLSIFNNARVTINGNVGIGTTEPAAKLDVNGDIYLKGKRGLASDGVCTYLQSGAHIYFETAGSTKMILTNDGKVGIGITNPGNYKLNVSGRIRADEVVVNITGADFVFAPDYKLLSLPEVEKFIKENKHLPDLAPATEMKEKGMNVSEMQTKLLQKIEELTLYTIGQNKRIEALENDNKKLNNK